MQPAANGISPGASMRRRPERLYSRVRLTRSGVTVVALILSVTPVAGFHLRVRISVRRADHSQPSTQADPVRLMRTDLCSSG